MSSPSLRVLISGGGTGGHIHPALAIAEALKAKRPDVIIEFVGARGRMEMERVPAAGHIITGLPITGIDRRLSLRNLLFPFRLARSIWISRRIVNRFRPDVAIGVGGFASGPLLWVAAKTGVPTVIQEQNGFPGITNRLLSKHVNKVCAGFPGLERWFPSDKIIETGNPLRSGLIQRLSNGEQRSSRIAEARKHFGLDENLPVLLVLGGSLGAASMNDAVRALVESSPLQSLGFQVLWQCGSRYAQEHIEWTKALGNQEIQVFGFIDRMDLAYDAATIIASRAGAMSIAELALVGKPTLLVPSPHVAEDHQTKNAHSVVDRNGAILIADDQIAQQLGKTVQALLKDEKTCVSLSKAMARTAKPRAAERVAEAVIEVISSQPSKG